MLILFHFLNKLINGTRIRKAVLCPAFTSNTETFHFLPDAADEDFLVLFAVFN